jgi:hypothetical protein
VEVSVHTDGRLPDLSTADVDRIAIHVGNLLAATHRSARITMTAADTDLTASVVCTGPIDSDALAPYAAISDDALQLTCTDDAAWLTILHNPQKGCDLNGSIDRTSR